MSAEEAFQLLHRLVPQTPSDAMQGLTRQQLLDGLEAACWRRFSPGNARPSETENALRLAVPYTQLYHGIEESIRDKEAAIQSLEGKIRETVLLTNELPRRIKAHEQEIAATIASFVSLSAASLDCAVQRNRKDFGKNLLKCRVDTDLLAEKVRERIATLRRRKDLRAWACDQLRGQINDHMTRASELKKEITHALGEVKKEEMAHKVKTKRMEEAMASMACSPSGRKNSMSGYVATKVLVGGGLAAMATAASIASPTAPTPGPTLHERLTLALEKRHELHDEIEARKEQVRCRTEEIFDVRNENKALEAQKADMEAQAQALEEEMVHIQRACTPRPNWDELERAVALTTAADQMSRNVRASLHSRDRRRGELEEDDESNVARKLRTILASSWSTVEKVEALAQELCRIRDKYHGGEEITAERAKLAQLQKEIQQTLEQLSTIRSLTSRGTGSA